MFAGITCSECAADPPGSHAANTDQQYSARDPAEPEGYQFAEAAARQLQGFLQKGVRKANVRRLVEAACARWSLSVSAPTHKSVGDARIS